MVINLEKLLVFIIIFTLTLSPATREVFAQGSPDSKKTVEIKTKTVKEAAPYYATSLKKIKKQATKNLKKINSELKARENEKAAKEFFDEGNLLYKEGDLPEAEKKWEKALDITKDRDLKSQIRKAKKMARQERAEQEKKQRELEGQKHLK